MPDLEAIGTAFDLAIWLRPRRVPEASPFSRPSESSSKGGGGEKRASKSTGVLGRTLGLGDRDRKWVVMEDAFLGRLPRSSSMGGDGSARSRELEAEDDEDDPERDVLSSAGTGEVEHVGEGGGRDNRLLGRDILLSMLLDEEPSSVRTGALDNDLRTRDSERLEAASPEPALLLSSWSQAGVAGTWISPTRERERD